MIEEELADAQSPREGQGGDQKELGSTYSLLQRVWLGLYTVLPQGTAASTKNKLPGLITSMETIGAKALEDFADNIKVLPLLPPGLAAWVWGLSESRLARGASLSLEKPLCSSSLSTPVRLSPCGL